MERLVETQTVDRSVLATACMASYVFAMGFTAVTMVGAATYAVGVAVAPGLAFTLGSFAAAVSHWSVWWLCLRARNLDGHPSTRR